MKGQIVVTVVKGGAPIAAYRLEFPVDKMTRWEPSTMETAVKAAADVLIAAAPDLGDKGTQRRMKQQHEPFSDAGAASAESTATDRTREPSTARKGKPAPVLPKKKSGKRPT